MQNGLLLALEIISLIDLSCAIFGFFLKQLYAQSRTEHPVFKGELPDWKCPRC